MSQIFGPPLINQNVNFLPLATHQRTAVREHEPFNHNPHSFKQNQNLIAKPISNPYFEVRGARLLELGRNWTVIQKEKVLYL